MRGQCRSTSPLRPRRLRYDYVFQYATLMQTLLRRLRAEGVYLGNNIVKVDGIVNHQVHPDTMNEAGQAFVRQFRDAGVGQADKILTAETSGIVPAFGTANLLRIPMVFARKRQPVTMTTPALTADAPSRTGDGFVTLRVSPDYLKSGDRVLIVDDFLGSGRTLMALADIVRNAGAILLGIGCLIEKQFEEHDPRLQKLGIPVISLVKCDLRDGKVLFYDGTAG